MGRSEVVQCKSCPWRVGCDPERDIPGYDRGMAERLTRTIRSGVESLFGGERRVMACHYSELGEEVHCAGWLHNQIGPGNNIGVRLAVARGKLPVPKVDGPQHERFEDTLPRKERRRRRGA